MNKKLPVRTRKGRVRTDQKSCGTLAGGGDLGPVQRPLHSCASLTDELSTAKERRLIQFGTAVLVWCGKSVKFDRVCRTFVELNLGSPHGTPSESDVAPVSLQSQTYSGRFGT